MMKALNKSSELSKGKRQCLHVKNDAKLFLQLNKQMDIVVHSSVREGFLRFTDRKTTDERLNTPINSMKKAFWS